MKLGPIICVLVIVGALGFGAYAFKNSMVAYIPFSQAVQASSTGATVQIMGVPVQGSAKFDDMSHSLDFTLQEKATGAVMPIVFKSPKPDNFDKAISITAIGHYATDQKAFVADNLLVKCPSKYTDSTDRNYPSKI